MAEVRLVTEPVRERLNERQLIDYRSEREQCLDWLLHFGKDPERAEGYAVTTVKTRAARMDQFYRWVWEQEGSYRSSLTHEHADAYLRELARQQTSNAHKDSCRKALMMLFKWRHHQRGDEKWEPQLSFSSGNQSTTPRDYLTREERTMIRNAVLEYATVPSRDSVHGDERDRWRAYLAQRFEKSKSELTAADWERANSWKFPTLVWVSLDAGLRPIEVKRARTSWVDLENGLLRIPREDSSKNSENWKTSLQDRTVTMLGRWLEQRTVVELYDDTDKLWLTRFGNPYESASLRNLLHRLCDIDAIERGRYDPSLELALKLAAEFDCRVEDLFWPD